MPEQVVPPTGLVVQADRAPLPVAPMSEREFQTIYRYADALYRSRLFKDVDSAHQAFAKLIIGRDLGLSPAQSLQLYAMEGKIEVPYPMLATFVRSRPGYDFTIEWREDREGGAEWVTVEEGGREITGARVLFYVDETLRGVSTFTREDADRAGLRDDKQTRSGHTIKSNHVKYPRNMLLARAMSNGVKFHVPEVLGGLPVYAEGELPRTEALGAGDGSGEGPGWGDMPVDLAGECERVLRRAERLGHAGLSNRESVQLQLHGQTDGAVRVWVREATGELDALAKIKAPLVADLGVVDGQRLARAVAEAAEREEEQPDQEGPGAPDAAPEAGADREEPQDVAACDATDPMDDGRRCTLPNGHDGMHRADGVRWDAASRWSADMGPGEDDGRLPIDG